MENRTKWRMELNGESARWYELFRVSPIIKIIVKKRIVLITSEAWLNFWKIRHWRSNILSFVEERNEEEKLRESHIGMTAMLASFWSSIAVPSHVHLPTATRISIYTPTALSARIIFVISPRRYTHSHLAAATIQWHKYPLQYIIDHPHNIVVTQSPA